MSEELLDEVRRAIERVTGRHHPQPDRKYHQHDEYLAYGLKASEFREILKPFRLRFLELSLQESLDLAVKFLREHIGELGHVGLYIIALNVKEITTEHYSYLGDLCDDFRSWSHADSMSLGILQPLLKKYPTETLALCDEWSRSSNRFQRRASVVVFTRRAGKSGEFTEEMLRICDHLIWDKEDTVQKGVGWALKDNLRSAPDRVLTYIKELRRKGVPSTITLYAIRDLKGKERQKILRIKRVKQKPS